MKKVFSSMLAVAIVLTMIFSVMSFSASAAEKVSLLPAAETDFNIVAGGNKGTETMTITKEGTGYKFVGEAGGWPQAWYMGADGTWATANVNDADCYLNWDFEVVDGGANIVVFFAGQSPMDQATEGTGESINYYIDSANNKLSSNAVVDLAPGKYSGSVHVKDTGIGEGFIDGEGKYFISGIKVFAVGGTVIVNDISVGPKTGDVVNPDDNTTKAPDNTTKAPDNTTKAQSTDNTTQAPAATTTVAKTTAANNNATDSAKTGDLSNAVVFIVVALVAAGVVTMSIVASKKKKNDNA